MRLNLETLMVLVIAFLIGLVLWNIVPGMRFAKPHQTFNWTDEWTPPTNPHIPGLPCYDTTHPGMNWRANPVDGYCHEIDGVVGAAQLRGGIKR